MTNTNQDFSIREGEDAVVAITITDENGTPIDLTNYTLKWQAARSRKQVTPLIEKTDDTGGGLVVTDALNGELDLVLDSIDTEGIVGSLYHEMAILDVDDKLKVVLTGIMTVFDSRVRFTAPTP